MCKETYNTNINISALEENRKQYFQTYPQENNISIDILNNDCLGYIFKCLPIADRLRSQMGEYSTYVLCFLQTPQDRYRYFFAYIYIYIVYFCYYSLQTLEGSEWEIVVFNKDA